MHLSQDLVESRFAPDVIEDRVGFGERGEEDSGIDGFVEVCERDLSVSEKRVSLRTPPIAPDNMNWASKVYSFTASDDLTRLSFTSTTAGGYPAGPFIDNVVAIARAGMVCHTNNGNGQPRTLNLTEGWAFWAHTQHGDQMGACP